MSIRKEEAGALCGAVSLFLKVSRSYWKGLFRCYRAFPTYRAPTTTSSTTLAPCATISGAPAAEKEPSPAMVVRGSIGVVAAVVTPPGGFVAQDIRRPTDIERWRTLRASLERRRESRRAQLRFRRDPAAYLAKLEEQLLKQALPS
jgi:hypothetical protein